MPVAPGTQFALKVAGFENLNRPFFFICGERVCTGALPVKPLLDITRPNKGVGVMERLNHRFENLEQFFRLRVWSHLRSVGLRNGSPIYAPVLQKSMMCGEGCGK